MLNSLSGSGLAASWECIAPLGRFIEIGKKDIMAYEKLPMFPFPENVTFSAVDMGVMGDVRPWHVRELLTEIIDLATKSMIYPSHPLRVYSITDLELALRQMQSGNTMGKLVVEMNDHDQIKVSP